MSSLIERASSSSSQNAATLTRSPRASSVNSVLPSRPLLLAMRPEAAAEDMPGRAIVPLQPDHRRAREVLLEAQDVVDLGAAPAVDGLVVVPHAADVRRAAGKQPQPQILGDVGILVLVHQDVAEPLLVVGQHVRVLAEQAQHLQQQVAEVRRVQLLEALLVGGIELRALALAQSRTPRRRGTWSGVRPRFFQRSMRAASWRAGQRSLSRSRALDHLLDEAQLIVGIEDREAGLQAHQLAVAAQDLDADGVEGAEPRHAFDRAADQRADALLHLPRGLVGEGDGEDLRGARPSRAQDMGDARGEHARLAGPGACEHQHLPVDRFDGRALFRIELAEIAGLAASQRPRRNRPARRRGSGLRHSGHLPIRRHSLQL